MSQRLQLLFAFNVFGAKTNNTCHHKFDGRMTNQDWNILAALPSLTYINLIDNDFRTDFPEITIEPGIISTIQVLKLRFYNNFYGEMDVSTVGFFSHFPDLERIDFQRLDIEGHFDNFDIFSTDHMQNLTYINIDRNKFTGSITLSDGLSFNPSLQGLILEEMTSVVM